MTASLSHLKILDLSRVLAGPWATQNFGDLGAEIWKIEKPGSGDETRGWGPPYVIEPSATDPGLSAYFASTNRNKKSLAIDFTTAKGADLITKLAGQADILIENFKVGNLARYGLDYAHLSAQYPHLIYCSLTGFGQDGPDSQRPGYDFMIQAMCGLMSITGQPENQPGGMPVKVGVALVDILTGLNANIAIMAALEHRGRTGIGQHIDMSLFDVGVSSLANQALNYLATGIAPQRMGNAHPNIVPYQAFGTIDGYMILAIGNDQQFARFCEVAGSQDLALNPDFSTNAQRVRHRSQLIDLLVPIVKTKTTEAWLSLCAEISVPASAVNDLERVFNEPQALHRELAQTSPEINGNVHRVVASPLRLSETPAKVRLPAPRLGEHTDRVLREILGMDEDQVANLDRSGVIFVHNY